MRTGCTSGAAGAGERAGPGEANFARVRLRAGRPAGRGVQGPLSPTRAAGPRGGTWRRTSSCHPREQARGWVPGGVESSRSFSLAPEKPPFPRHCPPAGRSSACRSEPPGTRDLEGSVLAPEGCARPAPSSPLAPGDAPRGEVPTGDERRAPGSGSALRVATHPPHCAGSRTRSPLPALPQGPLQPRAGLRDWRRSAGGTREYVAGGREGRAGEELGWRARPTRGPRPVLPTHNLRRGWGFGPAPQTRPAGSPF